MIQVLLCILILSCACFIDTYHKGTYNIGTYHKGTYNIGTYETGTSVHLDPLLCVCFSCEGSVS